MTRTKPSFAHVNRDADVSGCTDLVDVSNVPSRSKINAGFNARILLFLFALCGKQLFRQGWYQGLACGERALQRQASSERAWSGSQFHDLPGHRRA